MNKLEKYIKSINENVSSDVDIKNILGLNAAGLFEIDE